MLLSVQCLAEAASRVQAHAPLCSAVVCAGADQATVSSLLPVSRSFLFEKALPHVRAAACVSVSSPPSWPQARQDVEDSFQRLTQAP